MLESITLYQDSKIKDNYVIPYVDIIKDTLADVPNIDQEASLKALLSLIVKNKSAYSPGTLKLDIREVVEKEDFHLKNEIKKILVNASAQQIQQVYKALYTLFHEFRLNKSPDSPYIDEQNTVAANNHDPYALTATKIGKLSQRLVEKKLTWQQSEPSDNEIEKSVVNCLNTIIANTKKDVENTQEPISQTNTTIPTVSKNRDHAFDDLSPEVIEDIFKRLENTNFDFFQLYKKFQDTKKVEETEQDDLLIAQLLQEEENKLATINKIKEFQEEEDHKYARYLSQHY